MTPESFTLSLSAIALALALITLGTAWFYVKGQPE